MLIFFFYFTLISELIKENEVHEALSEEEEKHHVVMITYNIYIVIRETGQFSSKGIINDFIGNLNRLTVFLAIH